MDPITLAIGAVGLGTSLYGMFSSHGDSKRISALQQQQTGLQIQEGALQQNQFDLQQKVNAQRQDAMEMSARRQNVETFRQAQKLRAQSIFNSTSQGAAYGSGAQSGASSTKSQGLFAGLGINQNLAIGRNIFGLDNQISENNKSIAGLRTQESIIGSQISMSKSDMANDQQWTQLGNQIMGGAGTLGKVGTYLGGSVQNLGTSLSWLNGGPTGFLSNR